MCGSGLLWSYSAESALNALTQRHDFLTIVREHAGWSLDHAAAELIYTELIDNVIQHAPGAVKVKLQCDGRSVLLGVSDLGPGFELEPRLPDTYIESGRGLFLVAQFAIRLWVEPNAGRGVKIVAELPRSPA